MTPARRQPATRDQKRRKPSLAGRSVLVSAIGGNVGQGVLRCLRADFDDLMIVGIDVNDFTAGHHFCDYAYKVPYAADPGYAQAVAAIADAHPIDLAIPCTDYESYYLPQVEALSPRVLGIGGEIALDFLDKYRTAARFAEAGIAFAATALPSDYDGRWKNIVVKPREGRGSRDVVRNCERPQAYDDSFIVQELLEGEETTSAVYVDKRGSLHGLICFRRQLLHGMTERCSVAMEYAPAVADIARKMAEAFSLRGPFNIQAIAGGDGSIVPFEINFRYSGTASIRSQLGFPDVRFGIQEYLLEQRPEEPAVIEGSAIRLSMDIIYPHQSLAAAAAGSKNSFIF